MVTLYCVRHELPIMRPFQDLMASTVWAANTPTLSTISNATIASNMMTPLKCSPSKMKAGCTVKVIRLSQRLLVCF
jgi:hypothetical protein